MKKLKIGVLSVLFLNTLSLADDFVPTNIYCSPTVSCKNNNCKLNTPSPFNVRSNINSNPGALDGMYYFEGAYVEGGMNGGNCIYVSSYNGGGIIGFFINPSVTNVGANLTTGAWHQGSQDWECGGSSPNDVYKCSWNLLGYNQTKKSK